MASLLLQSVTNLELVAFHTEEIDADCLTRNSNCYAAFT